MMISECSAGDVVRIPGIDLELEVLSIGITAALVRPGRKIVRKFETSDGDLVEIRATQRSFGVSLETIVERGP